MNYRFPWIAGGWLVKFRLGMSYKRTVPSSAAHAISRERHHIRDAADAERHVKKQARREPIPRRTAHLPKIVPTA